MRPQFLHLTGPRRGRTDTPKGPEVVIGTGVDSGLRLGPWRGLADRHAVVTFDDCGCDFLIRALDGQVFVNHREVDEVILHQGDLIELHTATSGELTHVVLPGVPGAYVLACSIDPPR